MMNLVSARKQKGPRPARRRDLAGSCAFPGPKCGKRIFLMVRKRIQLHPISAIDEQAEISAENPSPEMRGNFQRIPINDHQADSAKGFGLFVVCISSAHAALSTWAWIRNPQSSRFPNCC
jgi:hypothetical protein